ncbi:MAG: hypothetical protein IIY11_00230 [Clostridia bacterium]|nr:hypothetical protein [Clostridia bacterium]
MFFAGLLLIAVAMSIAQDIIVGLCASIALAAHDVIPTALSTAGIYVIIIALSALYEKVFVSAFSKRGEQKRLILFALLAWFIDLLVAAAMRRTIISAMSLVSLGLIYEYFKWRRAEKMGTTETTAVDAQMIENPPKTELLPQIVEPSAPNREKKAEHKVRVKVMPASHSGIEPAQEDLQPTETVPVAAPTPEKPKPQNKRSRGLLPYVCSVLAVAVCVLGVLCVKLSTENKDLSLSVDNLTAQIDNTEKIKNQLDMFKKLLYTAQTDLDEWRAIRTVEELITKAESANNFYLSYLAEYAEYTEMTASVIIPGENLYHRLNCYEAKSEAESYYLTPTVVAKQSGREQCDCIWRLYGYVRP